MSYSPHDKQNKAEGHMWTWSQYAPLGEDSSDQHPAHHVGAGEDEWREPDDPSAHAGCDDNDESGGYDFRAHGSAEFAEDDANQLTEPSAPQPSMQPEADYSGAHSDPAQTFSSEDRMSARPTEHISQTVPITSSARQNRSNSLLPASLGLSSTDREANLFGHSRLAQPLGTEDDLFEERYSSSVNEEEEDDGNDLANYESRGDENDFEYGGHQQNNYFMQPDTEHSYSGDISRRLDSHEYDEAYMDQDGHGLPSYLIDPQGGPSPTESQLVSDGFEFHRGLRGMSEERQMQRFGRIADMSILSSIDPKTSRKQQWYAFKQACVTAGDEGYDYDEEEMNESGNILEGGQGCRCQGDSTKCSCPTGQCGCADCGGHEEGEQRACECGGDAKRCNCPPGECDCPGCGHDEDDGDDKSIPMDIGKTPITPTFPLMGRVPGLGNIFEESQPDPASSTNGPPNSAPQPQNSASKPQLSSHIGRPSNPGCGCICGDNCACLKGQCNCDAKRAPQTTRQESYKGDRLANKPIGWLIKKAAEENEVDTYHPTHPHSPTRLPRVSRSGTSSPLGPPPRMTPIHDPLRRPDTPRPYDESIRQSVEPEGLPPSWYRHSTPGYEDRSPSPSPISHQGDVYMRDATPTFMRENSMPPPPSGTPRMVASQSPTRQPRPAPLPVSPTPAHYLGQHGGRPAGQPASAAHPHQNPGYEMYGQMQHFPTSASSQLPQATYLPPYQSSMTQQYPQSRPVAPPPQQMQHSHSPIRAPPIPSDTLQPAKNRKSNTNSRRKSVVTDSGISKPKSRAVSRKVTAKQAKPSKEKTAAQKKQDEGKVAAAVKKIEEKERKERGKREAKDKEDAARKQGNGTPVRRSGRIREKKDRASGNFGSDI